MPTGTADHTLLSQHYLSQDTVSLSYHINRCNLHCKLTLLYRPLWSLSQPLILLGISVSSSVGHCPTLSQLVYPLDIFGILQCILNTKMSEWMKRKYFCTRGIYYEDSNTSAMTRGRRNYDDRFDFEPENPKFRPIKYVDRRANANWTHTWIAELTMIWLLNSGISLSISPMWNLLVTWLVADLLNKYLIQFCHLDNNGGARTEWSGE